MSGASGIVGALVAYGAVEVIPGIRPYVLAFSAASLLYIAMSDLIPDLHRGEIDANALRQVLLIAAGIGTVVGVRTTPELARRVSARCPRARTGQRRRDLQ